MSERFDPFVFERTVKGTGLTKRELFAAMAMQGMLGYGEAPARSTSEWAEETLREWGPFVAKLSVGYADALLAALEQGQEVQRG